MVGGAERRSCSPTAKIVMGSSYNGRWFSAIEEQDQPIAMLLWDMQVFDLDGWIIPAGLPEERLNRVLDFVNFATDTQRLADQAAYISYGPARASRRRSSATMPNWASRWRRTCRPIRRTRPTRCVYNYEWWADYRDDLDAQVPGVAGAVSA